ncbi:MAG: hypothetical protein RIB47_13030 [Cyclobacteriaceae bacterium]
MKRLFNTVGILFVIYCFLSLVINLINSTSLELPPNYGSECREYSLTDSLQNVEIQRIHHRTWKKYVYDSTYCLSYVLASEVVSPSTIFRNQLDNRERSYEKYWRNIYFELHQQDKDLVSFLQDSLENIATRAQLTRNELAKLIVSFVQDIPYSYVVQEPCGQRDRPCRGNEKFGILSPVEFLYTLAGDCDTRSVLLYSILKHFNFDPLIVISNEYRHAMIAVDLPAAGDHILHKGKKFYFWETTATGWLPGVLPPDTNNIAYWKITLDHEYQTLASRNR